MPELPTVPEIVSRQRSNYIEVIASDGFIGFAGGCALTAQPEIIQAEGAQLAALQDAHESLATGQRLNPRKPRTPVPADQPQPWKGLETTEPRLAREIIEAQAGRYGSVALEVMLPEHVQWIDYASMIWAGARNEDEEVITKLALYDPRVLFGVKNALDGTFDAALERTKRINETRYQLAQQYGIAAAPAVLIYRGGDNAATPEDWEERRMEAFDATEGQMIDDVAHGSAKAHDEGRKSVTGQVAATEHLKQLASEGYAGLGLLSEASDTESRVDPNMPFNIGLNNIYELHTIKQAAKLALVA